MVITKSAKDLKPYLLDPRVKPIKNPYYLITDDEQTIFVVTSGLNGIEFNKTVGSEASLEGVTLCQCLYGQGILLLQRNDEESGVKEFKVVTLSSGRQVDIPAGWASCLVNVGKRFLVVLKSGVYEENSSNTEPILEKQGLSYYVIEKKGEIAFEQNPNYKVHPQITTE